MPPPLAAALRALLVDELRQLPSPELIYLPPRFHIDTLLLADGKFAEAVHWFARALEAGIGERGRFLAWRGDALTKLGDPGRAMSAYLAAFLENPQAVDLASLHSPLIHDLLSSLESEDHDFGSENLPAWPGRGGGPAFHRSVLAAELEKHHPRFLPTRQGGR